MPIERCMECHCALDRCEVSTRFPSVCKACEDHYATKLMINEQHEKFVKSQVDNNLDALKKRALWRAR